MRVTIKDGRTYYDDKKQGVATQGELELMRIVLEYENSITWQTSCTNCAKLMDKNYEQYVEIEKLKEANGN